MVQRLACLYVPLFPLAARLRSEPELRSEALVILEGNGPAARVAAANRVARRVGLRAGMSLPQARALMPKLIARGRDSACEQAAQQALLEAAESFSPRIEDAGEGLAYLDLTGTERRFAGEHRERALGEALVHTAEGAALAARCGIASSKLAARVAAGLPSTPTVVAAGDEASFLAPLPLERLTPELGLREMLSRWGIRTIGELAKLPRDEVASRLGAAGQKLHEIARGLDPLPLLPREPPPDFREGMDLEWPLVALEPFLFIGRAALDRLAARLEARGLGCARLGVELRLDPEGSIERSIALPAPTRDVKTLLTLVRLDLEAQPPGAPVVGFVFTAHPDHPRQAQLSLLGPGDISPDRLATALAKLFALLGPEKSGAPRPGDGHRPEGYAVAPYSPPPPPVTRPDPRPGRGLLTVRVLRPPLAVEVIATEPSPTSDSRPATIKTPPGEAQSQRLQIDGAVRVASGPWRMEESWWSDQSAAREYWDVELASGGLYRLYRDRASGDWFADGVYD
jgi:protein ImuB